MTPVKAIPSFPNSPVLNEKYRPTSIKDCILKEASREIFQGMVDDGVIKNMLLSGPAGSGKTTVAKALCKELDIEYILINASSKRGIDVLRDEITTFATTASMNGKRRCVILDESDYLPNLTQSAFRASIEEFSNNCSFIFTCNYPNQIIEPIKSRLTTIDFSVNDAELDEMVIKVSDRVESILCSESIEYNPDIIIEMVYYLFPDVRKVLNKIDVYAKNRGRVDVGIMEEFENVNVGILINYMATGDFKSVRSWCANAAKNDVSSVYIELYNELLPRISKEDIPKAILIINDAMQNESRALYKEIHLCALCTELLLQCEIDK